MTNTVSNADDIIDSRDVIARIEDLESELDGGAEDEGGNYFLDDGIDATCDYEELRALRALAEEGKDAPDWADGETMIRDTHFVTYAEELAEDIGAIGRDAQWPLGHIDWEAAADTLKIDYFSVDFDGVEYWVRA